MGRSLTTSTTLVLAVLCAALRADEVQPSVSALNLHTDPFKQPKVLEERVEIEEPSLAEVVEVAPTLEAHLRATSIAGSASMVNVDGSIVMIGEVFQGFTLVEVLERSATFEKDGLRQSLIMY